MKPRSSASQQVVPFPVQPSVVPEGPCACAPTEPPSIAEAIDRSVHASIARFTGGISPAALALAFADWQLHLAASPGKQFALAGEAARSAYRFAEALTLPNAKFAPWSLVEPAPADRRFAAPDWKLPPFNMMAQAFLLTEQWWHSAATGVRGLSQANAAIADFAMRQCLDMAAPSNFAFGNPEVWRKTVETGGGNLAAGLHNWLEDARAQIGPHARGEARPFTVGKDVATAPGKVVYRNRLIELIQYAPQTAEVRPEPVLIVPAWIMKYYILDLSPRNSMVKYLVDQGHTVFTISWKNPTAADRELGMDDYVNLGLRAALDAVTAIVPDRQVHGVGYCIGGTLLSIGAATLAREGDRRLRSVTMFAAQTDFSEPGELALFINPSQLAMLEATMHKEGVLDSQKMGGAFQMLRPQDLIWQPMINSYLKGNRDVMIDLMAWNADGTRMPWKMHSEYLYRLYLDNELATNRFPVAGQPIRLSDIRVPMFVVGTETDHVAPWKSVYKTGNLVRSDDFTFLLTSSGHNAGIVAGPVHPKRHYRMQTRRLVDAHLAPDEWLAAVDKTPGSWWPAWEKWLSEHSSGRAALPAIGNAEKCYTILEDAPGQYVKQR